MKKQRNKISVLMVMLEKLTYQELRRSGLFNVAETSHKVLMNYIEILLEEELIKIVEDYPKFKYGITEAGRIFYHTTRQNEMLMRLMER